MGQLRVSGSGAWVQCGHGPNLWGCTGAMLGVADVGTGTGAALGTAGVCGFGVSGIVGATGGGCSSCAGLWMQKCEVWQEPVVWLL